MTLRDELGLEVRGQLGDGQPGAQLAGQLEGDPQVLAVERDLEPEWIVVDSIIRPLRLASTQLWAAPAAERLDDLARRRGRP